MKRIAVLVFALLAACAAGEAGTQEEARGYLEILAGSSATGWLDGIGEQARFNGPSGGVSSPDGTTLYVADTFNSVVRRVDVAARQVTTIAGKHGVATTVDGVGGAARFASPRAMVMAPAGDALYLADGPTLRKLALPSYAVTTIAGTPGMPGNVDGTGSAVRLGFLLHALEVSADGNTVYVADRSNRVLRALDLTSGEVRTVAGAAYSGADQHADGTGSAARFSGLGGITRVGDDLFVADTFNDVLRRVDLTTYAVTTVAGTAGQSGLRDGVGAAARFRAPQGLVAHRGALYSSSFDGVLRRVTLGDHAVSTILGDADDVRSLDGAGAAARLGLAFAQPIAHPVEDALFYQDRSASSLRRIELASLTATTVAGPIEPHGHRDGTREVARFDAPAGIAATAMGALFVSDQATGVVRRIDPAGEVSTLAGAPDDPGSSDGTLSAARFAAPTGLAWDEARGRLYVADTANSVVRAIDEAGRSVSTLAGAAGEPGTADGAPARARFSAPGALALDAGRSLLYVAEADGHAQYLSGGRAAIRVIDLGAQTVSTLIGGPPATPPVDGPLASASLTAPVALALDADTQRLYVAEGERATIRVVDLAARTIALYAGVDVERGPADGPLSTARFDHPGGIGWSAGERALYVTDGGASTIRRIDVAAGQVSTWLGDPTRAGGLAPGVRASWSEAIVYLPDAPLIVGGDLLFVSEHAVYRARPPMRLSP
jgi:sugar lactone lactonase YvrE